MAKDNASEGQSNQSMTAEELEEWVRAQGEMGQIYADEALHQNGDYFEEMVDDLEDLKEDFRLFVESTD